ncbi:MAG: hydrogenase formation protein HypD, partial [Nitrososphaerales archaeon]
MLVSVLMIALQIKKGEAKVENEYKRVVKYEGNIKALKILDEVFQPSDSVWRGLGLIKDSGMEIRSRFEDHDARRVFEDRLKVLDSVEFKEPPGCRCSEVIRGLLYPQECALFGKACTPTRPIGPCMVSVEGSCNIEYKYGRLTVKSPSNRS